MSPSKIKEAELRLECLKLAVNISDKKGCTTQEIADEFVRFVFRQPQIGMEVHIRKPERFSDEHL